MTGVTSKQCREAGYRFVARVEGPGVAPLRTFGILPADPEIYELAPKHNSGLRRHNSLTN
jgi:hypothetical protein